MRTGKDRVEVRKPPNCLRVDYPLPIEVRPACKEVAAVGSVGVGPARSNPGALSGNQNGRAAWRRARVVRRRRGQRIVRRDAGKSPPAHALIRLGNAEIMPGDVAVSDRAGVIVSARHSCRPRPHRRPGASGPRPVTRISCGPASSPSASTDSNARIPDWISAVRTKTAPGVRGCRQAAH